MLEARNTLGLIGYLSQKGPLSQFENLSLAIRRVLKNIIVSSDGESLKRDFLLLPFCLKFL